MTPEFDVERSMQDISKLVAKAAAKANAKPDTVAETDRGVHLTQEDKWERDLKEAAWVPVSQHRHSAVWRSPHDGLLHGGLFVCWSLMNEQQS